MHYFTPSIFIRVASVLVNVKLVSGVDEIFHVDSHVTGQLGVDCRFCCLL